MGRAIEPQVFIDTAEWLSEVFSAPLGAARAAQLATVQAQASLRWLGEELGAGEVAETLCGALLQDDPENLSVHLQRRYTALFEGIFRHKAVLPYESAWQRGDVQPIVDMDAILRLLDVRVSADCCEPPDHLAIELAALAMALRKGHNVAVTDLVIRLGDWVPDFSAALAQRDAGGFYAAASQLLLALIHELSVALAIDPPAATRVTERYEGEIL